MKYPRIPEHVKGAYNDVVSMHCSNSEEQAVSNFRILVSRFKNVNNWGSLSETVKTDFALFSRSGVQLADDPRVGNLIRIDIPGVGNPSGRGYDWTEIIELHFEIGMKDPFCTMTIKPCSAPGSENGLVSHFFTRESSNTFIVRNIGCCVQAEVHGRNEVENTSDVPLLDTVRNKFVATAAKFGLGQINWSIFTEALLEPFHM